MPGNHRKALSDLMLMKLESLYQFEYDADTDEVITVLSSCKKRTRHKASEPFVLMVKKLGKKVIFSKDAIEIWKSFRTNNLLSDYSLFAVNNAMTKLMLMYQEPSRQNVSDMLKSKFDGIKRI